MNKYLFLLTLQLNDVFALNINNIQRQNELRRNLRPSLQNTPKVIVKVYYETLCPASVDFFITQLQPTVESLGSYMEVVMIPYGHAQTLYVHGSYKFRCQHGRPECHGNKLHACAIDVIPNNIQAVLFNTCLMQYFVYKRDVGIDFASAFNWCGYKFRINLRKIWTCLSGVRGTTLLKSYGEETQALRPHYVPFIVVNGSMDTDGKASTNLMATVCSLMASPPPPCKIYV